MHLNLTISQIWACCFLRSFWKYTWHIGLHRFRYIHTYIHVSSFELPVVSTTDFCISRIPGFQTKLLHLPIITGKGWKPKSSYHTCLISFHINFISISYQFHIISPKSSHQINVETVKRPVFLHWNSFLWGNGPSLTSTRSLRRHLQLVARKLILEGSIFHFHDFLEEGYLLAGGFTYLGMFIFGEMIQFDDHMFQMGWFNHQLVGGIWRWNLLLLTFNIFKV